MVTQSKKNAHSRAHFEKEPLLGPAAGAKIAHLWAENEIIIISEYLNGSSWPQNHFPIV